MKYDKATGDVTILQKEEKVKNTIINNHDDMVREKAALYKELGITDGDLDKHNIRDNLQETAQAIYDAQKIIDDDFDIKPDEFFVATRDNFRMDVGLIIMRVPIFLHMRKLDIEFQKLRSQIMNEYYCDFRRYIKDFGEVTIMNEDILT